jgi:hypothetical protein
VVRTILKNHDRSKTNDSTSTTRNNNYAKKTSSELRGVDIVDSIDIQSVSEIEDPSLRPEI